MIKFKVFRSKKNKQFYFHILSRNGRLIAQSEGYKRAASAWKVIDKIQEAISDGNFMEVNHRKGAEWLLV